jgi:Sulfotransferase family
MTNPKCIIILSTKSSGSSACQNLLAKLVNIRHIEITRHFENESLYWTKAASVLCLPQLKMIDSEVPIAPSIAKTDMITLLEENLGFLPEGPIDKEFIFSGWNLLCHHYSPVFIEKSPHHLVQWSAIELILECIESLKSIDFLVIGLIRNPMDTLYSAYKRWKILPEHLQEEWYTAYHNLTKLEKILGNNLAILRYEDMVSSLSAMNKIFEFCGVNINNVDSQYLHSKSIQKWKKDSLYGFQLSSHVAELAKGFGYKEDEIVNKTNSFWPILRYIMRGFYKAALIANYARNYFLNWRVLK